LGNTNECIFTVLVKNWRKLFKFDIGIICGSVVRGSLQATTLGRKAAKATGRMKYAMMSKEEKDEDENHSLISGTEKDSTIARLAASTRYHQHMSLASWR
jgi:orotate phosphoribosyltransferase